MNYTLITPQVAECAMCHICQKPSLGGGGGGGWMPMMVLEDIMIKMLKITETRSHTAVPYLGLVSKKRLTHQCAQQHPVHPAQYHPLLQCLCKESPILKTLLTSLRQCHYISICYECILRILCCLTACRTSLAHC